jgi:hypothetical protein
MAMSVRSLQPRKAFPRSSLISDEFHAVRIQGLAQPVAIPLLRSGELRQVGRVQLLLLCVHVDPPSFVLSFY